MQRPGHGVRRKWLYRLAAMTLVPTLLFALLEGSLRLAGYGLDTSFFLDGSKVEGSEVWIDNPEFERWVFPPNLQGVSRPVPFVFPKSKSPGTYRIFVLGESAAMGFPEPSMSFARVLEAMLRTRYPDTRFEVINTAMVAMNSHVILPIARQCARHQPDLFVVHLGNNEVVGPFGAAGVLGPFSPSLRAIRANLAVKTTRSGQLLQRLVGGIGQAKQAPRAWEGMSTFTRSHVRAEDERMKRIYSHFAQNLEDICRVGADAGAAVLVCTIPVNLKDSAPFGSLHRQDLDDEQQEAWEKAYQAGVSREEKKQYSEAVRLYEEAAKIDDQFADLAYRLGRSRAALGKKAAAHRHYERARDLDTLRFRSDSTINQTIRDVVARRANPRVRLADAERAFEQNSPDGLPGEELFLEHVHMNFKGNYLLAHTVFDCIDELAPPFAEGKAGKVRPVSEQQCADRLAYTQWNESKLVGEIVSMLTTQQPFTSQLDYRERGKRWEAKLKSLQDRVRSGGLQRERWVYEKAIEQSEGDWMIRVNYGQFLSECGAVEPAEEQWVAAVVQIRHDATIRCKLAGLYLMTQRVDEAMGHYREAARLDPGLMTAYFGMAQCHTARGEHSEAIAINEEQVRKGANRLVALLELGNCLARAGRYAEAEQRYLEAQTLSPNNQKVLRSLGDVAMAQEKWTEAIEHYETALRLWPEWSELRHHLDNLRKKHDQRDAKRPETPAK